MPHLIRTKLLSSFSSNKAQRNLSINNLHNLMGVMNSRNVKKKSIKKSLSIHNFRSIKYIKNYSNKKKKLKITVIIHTNIPISRVNFSTSFSTVAEVTVVSHFP